MSRAGERSPGHSGLADQVRVGGSGAVEAVLATVPGVREAGAVAREGESSGLQLVAQVVGDVTADALRRALRERLPELSEEEVQESLSR
jgi:hypothetical protein